MAVLCRPLENHYINFAGLFRCNRCTSSSSDCTYELLEVLSLNVILYVVAKYPFISHFYRHFHLCTVFRKAADRAILCFLSNLMRLMRERDASHRACIFLVDSHESLVTICAEILTTSFDLRK